MARFWPLAEIDDLFRFAEINAAGQFADDEQVKTVDQLALQRGGVGERRIADRRAQVRVEIEILAQPQQASLGPQLVRHFVPFRPADGGEQDGVGRAGARHVGLADRDAMRVIGRAADKAGLDLEMGNALLGEEMGDLLDLGHHLGADAVARQYRKASKSTFLLLLSAGFKQVAGEGASPRCPFLVG